MNDVKVAVLGGEGVGKSGKLDGCIIIIYLFIYLIWNYLW